MTSRIAALVRVLRHPQPVRPLLGHELRGSVVQLLAPGTTDPTWTATPELLAAALDASLAQGREEKDTPASRTPAGTASTARTTVLAVLQEAGYSPQGAAELLARSFREPHASPADADVPESLAGGHALVLELGDCSLVGTCQCGRVLGRTTLNGRSDSLTALWERHTISELPALASP